MGLTLERTASNSKAHTRRLFLGMQGASPLEINKQWTQYKRQGFKITEQLQLDFLDEKKEETKCY